MTALTASAQSDDFGIWTSIQAEKKINTRWSAGFEAEMRTRDNVGNFDRWSAGLDLEYKIMRGLKISGGYSFLYDNNERISYYEEGDGKVEKEEVSVGDPKKMGQYWGARHRFNVSLTGQVKFGDLEVSLRERWQYTYRPEYTVDERWSFYNEEWDGEEHVYKGKGKNVLRSRLQLEYKLRSLGLTPFASAEMYNAWSVQKMRYTVGTDWKLSKQHVFSLYYRYDNVRNDDYDNEPNRHVIGVGYKFKF
ncbi:MAG: DUF2490 domain-containing protein [Prevotella sp.]|nr:DUF2490 domain-containing protein [Prevotella sp.]